ncbi:unnamed protein product, partial [Vitis vinifera]|uniref:Uncharacterized protein n=1 Tax=Vitis vinifera TaxID=29760 RepID=D7UD61_VITVI
MVCFYHKKIGLHIHLCKSYVIIPFCLESFLLENHTGGSVQKRQKLAQSKSHQSLICPKFLKTQHPFFPPQNPPIKNTMIIRKK